VRTDGRPEHLDDPGGGVLDFAPDRRTFSRVTYAGIDDHAATDDLSASGHAGAHAMAAASDDSPPLHD
jgi:hypothetical protein